MENLLHLMPIRGAVALDISGIQSIFKRLIMQWRLVDDGALHFRCWDREFVVYNALTGDTHLLETSAAEILLALKKASLNSQSLARFLATKLQCELNQDLLDEVETTLIEMHALALVEPA